MTVVRFFVPRFLPAGFADRPGTNLPELSLLFSGSSDIRHHLDVDRMGEAARRCVWPAGEFETRALKDRTGRDVAAVDNDVLAGEIGLDETEALCGDPRDYCAAHGYPLIQRSTKPISRPMRQPISKMVSRFSIQRGSTIGIFMSSPNGHGNVSGR